MKAKIKSYREGAHKDSSRHTILVFFGDENTTKDLNGAAARYVGSSIAAGDTDYQLTLDLAVAYANKPELKDENGNYSPSKGLAYFQNDVRIGDIWEGVNLYVIPLSELTDGKINAVEVADTGRTFTAYRRAFFCDRAQAVQIVKNAFASSLAAGAFILPEQKSENASAAAKFAEASEVTE